MRLICGAPAEQRTMCRAPCSARYRVVHPDGTGRTGDDDIVETPETTKAWDGRGIGEGLPNSVYPFIEPRSAVSPEVFGTAVMTETLKDQSKSHDGKSRWLKVCSGMPRTMPCIASTRLAGRRYRARPCSSHDLLGLTGPDIPIGNGHRYASIVQQTG